MHIHGVAAFAAALLLQPLIASAQETDADTAAGSYFARACADKVERVVVYAPDIAALSDITTGATSGAVSWDRFKFEQLCARPELYVYHCHTTDDVLAKFPSGAKGGAPGDFGTAAEMEFTCAKAAVLNDHPVASLAHGLVTPRGEIVKYGFTEPTLAKIREQGRDFGRMLRKARPRQDLERAQADAQASFNRFNAEHFDSFIDFAVKACPSGDIEHCRDLTVERFANTLPRDDWRFIRVASDPETETGTDAADRDQRISDILERIKKQAAATVSGGHASADQMPSITRSLSDLDNVNRAAQVQRNVTDLTPETLGAFVGDDRAIVSICAKDAVGLRPCPEAKERMIRLAGACPQVKMGILDQDKHPPARYLYPVARDRSLLLFKTNPASGLNEEFNLTTLGEPTPQLIGMVLCGKAPFDIPSFSH